MPEEVLTIGVDAAEARLIESWAAAGDYAIDSRFWAVGPGIAAG